MAYDAWRNAEPSVTKENSGGDNPVRKEDGGHAGQMLGLILKTQKTQCPTTVRLSFLFTKL